MLLEQRPRRTRQYDVVVVLGGNIRIGNEGAYHSTTWKDGPEKSVGSFWRPLAAAELVRQGRTRRIIFSTGPTTADPAFSEAQTMQEEFTRELMRDPLYDRYQFSVENETQSLRTIENAQHIATMLKNRRFKKAKTIAILSSSYHLARVHEMFASEFKRQGIDKRIVLLSAERILIEAEQKRSGRTTYLETSRRAYRTRHVQKQIENERQGIRDFRMGLYRHLPPGNKTY